MKGSGSKSTHLVIFKYSFGAEKFVIISGRSMVNDTVSSTLLSFRN